MAPVWSFGASAVRGTLSDASATPWLERKISRLTPFVVFVLCFPLTLLLFDIFSSCTSACSRSPTQASYPAPPLLHHLRLLWVFHMLRYLARLLRGSTPWPKPANHWFAETGGDKKNPRVIPQLNVWHQPAKMQCRLFSAAWSYMSCRVVSSKAWACATLFFFFHQVTLSDLREWLKKGGIFIVCAHLLGYVFPPFVWHTHIYIDIYTHTLDFGVYGGGRMFSAAEHGDCLVYKEQLS